MRSQDGQSQCERCEGRGCWSCERRGYHVQCPGCGCDNLGLLKKSGNEFTCVQCETVFNASGEALGRGRTARKAIAKAQQRKT